MSCTLEEISSLLDVNQIKKFLFPQLNVIQTVVSDDPMEDDQWDQDWEIEDEETHEEERGKTDEPNWLQQCCVSVSPTLDCMAVGYKEKLVILDNKWDYDDEQRPGKFEVVWSGSVCQEDGQVVTDILCLPLASQKRSNQWTPDWVCVIVGFSSGSVHMYSESGTLLLSQLLHEERVLKLKCRTYETPRYSAVVEQQEELTILFPRAIVTIDGFSLFQCLRACRNQVARAVASGGEAVQPPPLAYKKWGFHGQSQLVDHVSSGLVSDTTFDQMQKASIIDGFNAVIKPSAPAHSLYATVGTSPFLGFYDVIEGSGQPLLTDMAYAVASKLKSALFSKVSVAGEWFGFGSKPADDHKDKAKVKVEPATPLRLKYGLPDVRRCGESIALSPHYNLAATCDSFGRVILVDLHKGLAVRVWKGYRDAQVAWIQVKEDKSSKVAVFLVIYAPRRGILEVWTAQMGDRVAAFNVSKGCQLLYPDHGIMGLNNVTCRMIKCKVFSCFLVDSEGVIKVINIPFHLSLDEKNSKRARDLHLYRKIVACLKDKSGDRTQIKELIVTIKTPGIVKQALERIVQMRVFTADDLSYIFHAVLTSSRPHPLSDESNNLDVEGNILRQFCQYQLKLLDAYSIILDLDTDAETNQTGLEELPVVLGMSADQTQTMNQLLDCYIVPNTTKHVHFESKNQLDVSLFLGCFICPTGRAENDYIKLKPDLPADRGFKLAQFLFSAVIQNPELCPQLQSTLQELGISLSSLIVLFADYWLMEDDKSLSQCRGLLVLLKMLSSTSETEQKTDEGTWWRQMQTKLTRATHLSAALTMSLVCRCLSYDRSQAQHSSSEELHSGWESVSFEVEECNTLIRRLEDCLVLSSLFRSGQELAHDVSVAKILEGGKGIVPEVIAKWVASKSLRPSDVIKSETAVSSSHEQQSGELMVKEIVERMANVYAHFPKSLTHDALMINCCWEYTVLWNKDVELHANLSKAIDFLKLVQNSVLQHGTCSLMWSVFIAKNVSAAATLMEKVGKAPKVRLCKRDVGMTDTCLKHFLESVCELLDIFMQANCDANDVPVFNADELWNQSHGTVSLVELAIDQPSTNYILLKHHYHLAVLLLAISTFSMKSAKPLSLFDSKGQKALFVELTSHPYFSKDMDVTICNKRRLFLGRVLTEAVCVLPLDEDREMGNDFKSLLMRWYHLVMSLAKDFQIDPEYYRRQYVQELYSSGYDRMAEESLLAITDHEVMGSQLLLTCGLRLAHFTLRCDPPGSSEILSRMSPKLSTWLKSLDSSQLRHANVPLMDTAKLVAQTVNNLAEGHSEYEMAISLVELVQSLQ